MHFFRIQALEIISSSTQGNGQTEAANNLVLTTLRKNLEGKFNKWVDELHSTLWAFRTSTRGPTGVIAYALVFGTKVVLLVVLALPSYSVSLFDKVSNKQQWCLDLELLEERRIATRLKAEVFKQKNKFAHDKGHANRHICA